MNSLTIQKMDTPQIGMEGLLLVAIAQETLEPEPVAALRRGRVLAILAQEFLPGWHRRRARGWVLR